MLAEVGESQRVQRSCRQALDICIGYCGRLDQTPGLLLLRMRDNTTRGAKARSRPCCARSSLYKHCIRPKPSGIGPCFLGSEARAGDYSE